MNKIIINSNELLNILTNKSIFYKVKNKHQMFYNYSNCVSFKIIQSICIISTTNNYSYSKNNLNVFNENNKDIEFNINYLDIKKLISFINENKTREKKLLLISFTLELDKVIFHYNNNNEIRLNNEPLIYPSFVNALKHYNNDKIQIKISNNDKILSILKDSLNKYKKDKKIKLTSKNIHKGLKHKIILKFENNNLNLSILETIIKDNKFIIKINELCNIPIKLNKINEVAHFNFYLFYNIILALDNNIDNITLYRNNYKKPIPLIFSNDNNSFLIMSVAE